MIKNFRFNYNLRYKLFIKYKSNNKYKFDMFWVNFLIKKACNIIKKIIFDRGTLVFIDFNIIYDFKSGTNFFSLSSLGIKPGFIPKLLKEKKLVPDLFIFMDLLNLDILREVSYYKIPYISSITDFNFYLNIPYPIIISSYNLDRVKLFFFISIYKGLILDKLIIKNGKKK